MNVRWHFNLLENTVSISDQKVGAVDVVTMEEDFDWELLQGMGLICILTKSNWYKHIDK